MFFVECCPCVLSCCFGSVCVRVKPGRNRTCMGEWRSPSHNGNKAELILIALLTYKDSIIKACNIKINIQTASKN